MAEISVLLIASTGHIGGAVLDELVKTYPRLHITALVRSSEDLATLDKKYGHANVKPIIGSLTDTNLMENLAGNATIILNCGPEVDNGVAIAALLRGLAAQDRQAFYVGTSGAGNIWDAPTGEVAGRIWDDVADVDEILALLRINRIVMEANTDLVHTAMVAPAFVTGVSPSATHPAPLTFPDLMCVVRALDGGFTISKGVNRVSFVDVKELGRLYTALVGNALQRLEGGEQSGSSVDGGGAGGAEVWGPKAYYFGEHLEVSLRDFMSDHLVPALKKCGAPYPHSDEIKEATLEMVLAPILERLGSGAKASANSWRAIVYGANMRVRGTRARQALGFEWASGGDAGIADAVEAFFCR